MRERQARGEKSRRQRPRTAACFLGSVTARTQGPTFSSVRSTTRSLKASGTPGVRARAWSTAVLIRNLGPELQSDVRGPSGEDSCAPSFEGTANTGVDRAEIFFLLRGRLLSWGWRYPSAVSRRRGRGRGLARCTLRSSAGGRRRRLEGSPSSRGRWRRRRSGRR